jgi:hypothetical protein
MMRTTKEEAVERRQAEKETGISKRASGTWTAPKLRRISALRDTEGKPSKGLESGKTTGLS